MDEYGYGHGYGHGHGHGMNRVALDPLYEREVAARRDELRGFMAHAGTYLLVCAALLIANLLTAPGDLWVLWPTFGWGMGVASHAAGVLGRPGGRCHRHGSARMPSPPSPWMGEDPMVVVGRRPDYLVAGRCLPRRRSSPRRLHARE